MDNTATPLRGAFPANPFKGFKDAGNRYRTQSLFAEYPHDTYPAHFTLKREGRKGFVNLYEKYMEIADPTEYQVAVQLFGSWAHWEALKSSKWFMIHLNSWRVELAVKMESKRYHEMLSQVPSAKTGVAATKWLAERYGEKKATRTAGRPTKAEKEAHLRATEQEKAGFTEDAKRLGLS